MSKAKDTQKDVKKKPTKTLKEKRLAKKEKKGKQYSLVNIFCRKACYAHMTEQAFLWVSQFAKETDL